MRHMTTSTVQEYLASLPEDRRAAVTAVRAAINSNLPAGYQEGIQFRMVSWYVPLSKYPAGYGGNPKEPLPLLSMGSTKGHLALHMICFYGAEDLAEAFTADYNKSGKKLDMRLGCLRFKKLDDLALDVVVRNLARFTVDEHVAQYQSMRAKLGKAPAKKAGAVNKATAAKKATTAKKTSTTKKLAVRK